MNSEYRVVTRSSRLARIQTDLFVQKFLERFPGDPLDIIPMVTAGDRSLDAIANLKHAFSSDLEKSLLTDNVDIAVHSLKDMSVFDHDKLKLAAVLERANAQDVLVSTKFKCLKDLPVGAIIGTSSARRSAQIRAFNPKLLVKLCRGNVITRLEKLKQGQYDALILAAAGLERLSFDHGVFLEYLPIDSFTPSCGQGVIAVQTRFDDADLLSKLVAINHDLTAQCVRIEREIVKAFGGGCSMPLGVNVAVLNSEYQVSLFLGDVFGQRYLRRFAVWPRGQLDYSNSIADFVAEILKQGGGDILKQAQLDMDRGFHD